MSTAQRLSQIFGWVFVAVGLAGFAATGASMDPNHLTAPRLLGLFPVNVLHNIVHLLFGIAGLAMARTAATARTYLLVGGAIYLVLWVYGLFIGDNDDSAANFIPLNNADDWLHLLLGIGMIALGLIGGRDTARSSTANTASLR